jgi:hypothetical protein
VPTLLPPTGAGRARAQGSGHFDHPARKTPTRLTWRPCCARYLLRPALTLRMENLPGGGAAAFRKLADAGVNVELVLPVRISDKEFFAVICAGDAAAAEAALGGQVITE